MKIKLIILYFLTFIFASCKQSMDVELTIGDSELEKMMSNTSWRLIGNYNINGSSVSDRKNNHIGDILYFSDEIFGTFNGHTNTAAKALYVNDEKCAWWWAEDSKIYVTWARETAMLNGEYSMAFGTFPNLKEINSSEMILESSYDDGRSTRWVYSRVIGSGGTPPGGGSSSYEAPEVYYDDFTPGYTNMKVQFRIGNKNRTKVTSAKGHCGSKTASGNIGSAIITFNFSNLQRGTKYKVYCTVSGPGGNGTSDTVTLSTLD